jgi:predicted AAA+ superfamily ATPase
MFYDKIDYDINIRYWRAKNGAEVDFVIHRKDAYEVKVQAKNVNKKNYQAFIEKYPESKFHIISYDVDKKTVEGNDIPIINVWEL